ncbi:hypothetical protein PF007_g18996 [Phytophthora fragariae]|uniref:Sister chromatid cohesion protein n=1 Tax=Phytophthora fragariae TaxID=53985 RepID=A0A6A3R7M2_9STRA|nr:hypothetical protein PF009_g20206 [Phytophthora fragariae]KAE8990914.1 hypothetical protein PF011_g18154 [Phytophthora fragariae]KAE9091130.1 hypothetical protein PF007_g18996 [Phytophthora fragariae]
MRGGLFLFPLYVDPQDAAAADAREVVHPVASQPAAETEAVNPQRLATLIRSATTGSLGSANETTEIDADVLNSLPKWAQAVVQTGCFNAGAVHGLKPSPKNRLKRRLELQGEQESDQPRKRRSFGNDIGDARSIEDESGELQDCLDELNAEPDVDVEMEEGDVLPVFSTRAEIAADSVEKYAELLERLVENVTQRQQLENFERDNMDVFSSEEVKLLLQTMRTMEKNDWINNLEPDLLISLMSTFDAQIRVGLAVDVLGATLPKSEEGKLQPSKIDKRLVSSMLASLDVAICELIVMTTPQIDRRVLSEENIDNCFQLLHHINRRLLLPCIDTTYVTTASTPVAEEGTRRRSLGAKMSSSSRVNLRENKHIRSAIDQVAHVFCEFMDHLAALVLSVKLADQWVLPLSVSMVELFALEHSQYATSLQQSALAILRAVPTTELVLRSSLHLAVKRRFCGLFDSLLAHIMALLSKGLPSLRARVMKCLRGIVDVDPMLMAETGVQSAVQRCCSDEKPSVREAAVDLIGTYVLLQPLLFDKYFDVLAERVRDKGIKVRKSVCKIFKMALTSMQEQQRDADSEQELRRKSASMRCLVERIGDASEDQGVKNFIIDTFQEVWFGAELSSSRLSSPSSEFSDGGTLPPGWTTVTSEDRSDTAEVSSKFVSEDGIVANSVEEAWSSYRTPMVTPASVVKINDSKMDNSSEVVATIVEVIHGMPNLGWFAELLKRLLQERSSGTKKAAVRSTKSRSAEVAIAEDRSEKIIDRLVGCLMDLQEGTLLIGVSIKDGHEQFVACMTALSVFCEAKPELLARHLETIRVYLKEEDVKIQSLSVSMIDKILSVKRVSQSIALRLEDDLKLLVLRSPPSVVGPSVDCLATLATTQKTASVLLLRLLERFVLGIRPHKHIPSLSSLSEKDNYVLQRALFAAGKIVGSTDIDNITELVGQSKILQIGAITESLYELYKKFVRSPGNDTCSAKAVQGMGFLFPIRPRLFLRAQQDELLKHILTSCPGKKTLQCLVSMKELLLSEEQRLENGTARCLMNRSKSREKQVQGDQEADASLIGNVMQAELDSILQLSLQKIPQIRKEAVACIGALLTQGLVNPLQCIRNLVALETDRVSDVRDAAFSQLLALHERFRSEVRTPLIEGIQDSYSFQLNVYGNATALGIDDNKKEYCLFGRLYTTCLKPTKSHESLLLKSLVNQFTDQGSVLKQLKAKSATDSSKTSASSLKYLCYLAQIISTLPYDMEDEPLYIIYSINRYVSLRLGPVLDDLKEAFAMAGVAPEKLENEESDLSKINIDEYRPLASLPKSKLAGMQTNGRIAFALALMLRLKFALKRNYQLDNEKCATYKPSSGDPPVEARERSPKKLLLPSVDDLCQPDDPIELSWNLFMTAWFAARKDQKQLDIDLQVQEKPKASPKRRRRSRKVVAPKQQHSSENDSNEDDEFVEGFA